MRARTVRSGAAAALAAVTLAFLPACSSPGPAVPESGSPADAPPAAAPAQPGGEATDAQRAQFGQAHQGALALAALGGLGQAQGSTDDVRTLGSQIAADSRTLDDQVRTAADAQGIALGDQVDAAQQAVIADLQARSGQPFDQAWLRAVLDQQQQARDAANAVLSSPDASEEAKAAARDALARLDATAARLQQTAASAGAGTPVSVNAGTGGQAAEGNDPVVPVALVLAGGVLIGAAALRRRRSAA